jgi:predicted amidohydrolase
MNQTAQTIITVTNYELQNLANWQAYADKIRLLVAASKKTQSSLLALPEYAGIELCGWITGSLEDQFAAMQNHLDDYIKLYQSLAHEYQLYIQPGSLPVKDGSHYKNRAYFFGKHGEVTFQDKMILTPAEVSLGNIVPGHKLQLFDTDFGKVGIAICYDSEFPLLTHALAKAGARLILVPSCTASLHGYTRVSISCRARAIENQCYVANSYLTGNLLNCEYFSDHVGHAGIYSPADLGCPPDGIIIQSHSDKAEMLSAELDWNKLETIRQQGQTTNFNDMQDSMKKHADMTVISTQCR